MADLSFLLKVKDDGSGVVEDFAENTEDSMKGAARAVKASSSRMVRSAKTIQGAFRRATGGVQRLFKAATSLKSLFLTGIGSVILIKGIKSVASAAETQRMAIEALNFSMRSAGDFSEAASQDMQKFASQLQNVVGVGDETTLQLLALAKGFGTTNEGAKELVKAGLNFATAANISFEESVRRLGRAMSGSVDDISKFVPGVKDLTKAQLAAGKAAELVNKRFGGQATQRLRGFGGAMLLLKLTFGDFLEILGFQITNSDKLQESFSEVESAVRAISEAFDGVKGTGFGDFLASLIPSAKTIIKGFFGIRKAVIFLKTAFFILKAGFLTILIFILEGLEKIRVGFNRASAFILRAFGGALNRLGKLAKKFLVDPFLAAGKMLTKIFFAIAKQVSTTFAGLLDPIFVVIGKSVQGIGTLLQALSQELVQVKAFQEVAKSLEEGSIKLQRFGKNLAENISNATKRNKILDDSQKKVIATIDKLQGANVNLGRSFVGAAANADALADRESVLQKTADGLRQSRVENKKAIDDELESLINIQIQEEKTLANLEIINEQKQKEREEREKNANAINLENEGLKEQIEIGPPTPSVRGPGVLETAQGVLGGLGQFAGDDSGLFDQGPLQGFITERVNLAEQLNNELSLLDKQFVDKKIKSDKFLADKEKILQAQKNNALIGGTQALFGALLSISQQGGKKNFKIVQALAIASATVDTLAAAAKALKVEPPGFGFVLAAATLVAGFLRVRQIAATKVGGGGSTGGFGGGGRAPSSAGATPPPPPAEAVAPQSRSGVREIGVVRRVEIVASGFMVGDEQQFASFVADVLRESEDDDVAVTIRNEV